jgi:hypothetical protein
MAALITIKKSPAESITAGNVMSFKNDPKKVLSSEKTNATQK